MSLQIQVTADVASAGKQIEDFSKKSRIALTSLSLVAQDLPYGFIGIQNNLPGVISSFGELTREAGGVGGALKQLGSALIGPAGLFLAFSAVTAGVTYLTQKYGSLSNAINVLTSSNKIATISQLAYNKSISEGIVNSTDETAKINILVSTLNNLKAPLADRQAAYNELRKIQPEILGYITEENALNGRSANIIANLANQRKEYVRLKIQENAITAVLNKNAAEQLVLEEKVLNVAANLAATRERINKLTSTSLTQRQQETLSVLIQKESTQVQSLKSITNEYNALNKVTQSYLDKLDPTVIGIAKYNKQTQDLAQNLKDQAKAAKEAAKGNKIGTTTKGELGPGRLIDTLEAFQAYVRGNINIQKNSIDKILDERYSYRRKELDENFLLPKKLDKSAGALNKNPLIEYQFGQITAIIDALKQEAKFIDDAFREPLENLFVDFLQKGKLSFEDFTKSVMKNITQLVAKLAASKLFEALANLIPQIAGTIVPGGSEILQVSKFLGSGRSIFGAANLGGINGGGMNLNGQVVFVQRGADLVGVMNRTNAQIQRIG